MGAKLNLSLLREEYRLRIYENRVLKIFVRKREEDGSWRKLHNDELHGLCSSPNIVREIWIDGANWIRLAQHRVWWGSFCEHGSEPSGFRKESRLLFDQLSLSALQRTSCTE
jgi:hypothetical protein